MGKKAISTGSRIVGDIIQGEDLKTSANKRMAETVEEMQAQEGSGRKRRRKPRKAIKKTTRKKKTSVKRRRLTRTERDIFAQ